MQPDPGTIVVFSDIGCPWAHLAVYRLHAVRRDVGLEEAVRFDLRAFPLEIINGQPTPKATLDAEIPVAGALDPEAGWEMWQEPEYRYPVTTLPALEAVEAAKEQGLRASEQLDRSLRVAFFGQSRTISMRHVIGETASECPDVDVDALLDALDHGRARPALVEQWRLSQTDEVEGSPHLFLPDGTDVHNPGVDIHWEGEHGHGFPVVDRDDPAIYRDLLQRAAGT
ncbi:MAG: DsbA family protein [Actinomycetota bacterium]|nr:DsbA family protein [Actinomycetota bacterium]